MSDQPDTVPPSPQVTSDRGCALYPDLRLQIEPVPIASLTRYKRALRTHSPQQIEQLVASIRCFGLMQPLVVDEAGEVIAGRGLLEAARRAGYAEVPVVRLAHLGAAGTRALRLGLNRLAQLSRWDEALVAPRNKAGPATSYGVPGRPTGTLCAACGRNASRLLGSITLVHARPLIAEHRADA